VTEVAVVRETRTARLLDWVLAPTWLTFEKACFLSGWDQGSMLEIITDGGVDLNERGLIEKRSLWEFLEALVLTLHWDE